MEDDDRRPGRLNSYFAIGIAIMAPIAVVIIIIYVNVSLRYGAYSAGMDILRKDPKVIETFGSPIKDNFFVKGTIQTFLDGSASASLSTSITGPRAHGDVWISGGRPTKNGAWQINVISIDIDDTTSLTYWGSDATKGFQTKRKTSE